MHGQGASVKLALGLALLHGVLFAQTASLPWSSSWQRATPQYASAQNPATKLTVSVTDENGVAVASARVQLQPPPPALAVRCETDFAGHCEFGDLSAETCELRIEKAGFYAVTQADVVLGVTSNVDVTLTREHEVHEVVNVAESAPAIDVTQITSSEKLTGSEIVDIPYQGYNDYRGALTFIPGITLDGFGQAHVAGSETWQTLLLFDGFNATQPTNGQLLVRASVDSFRSINVEASREPAEFGKGSGGVMALNTRMGDDHFRVHSTDFVPGIQDIKGISISQWLPIYTVSGPIRKGKMWFIDSIDGEYDNNIIKQLPSGADSDEVWRLDNLAKVQSNLTTRNIVTASFLSNYDHDPYDGLSLLQPKPSTALNNETAYIGSVKDQYYFRDGALLETGFGVDQYSVDLTPHGDSPYIVLAPNATGTSAGVTGNYYEQQNTLAQRVQMLSNLSLPAHQWRGRHDIKAGFDLDRLNYDAQFLRQPISYLQPGEPPAGQPALPCATGANGVPVPPYTCTRYSVFAPGNYNTIFNSEASAYVEDRWLITNRLLIEPGLRFDWDQIVRSPLFSPRLAGTYILDDEGNTKLSAGIGIIYDNTTLGVVHQPFEGQRDDYFFECLPLGSPNCTVVPTDQNGNPISQPTPVLSTFRVNQSTLSAPRYVNWSLGFEKKLPYAVFLKLEFLEKRGVHGFAYNTLNGAVNRDYLLGNGRDDRYYHFEISARHRFRQRYEIFGAYIRSRSTTNQVFDFSLDFPLLSPQIPGPYPWDSPNHFISWGVLPGPKAPIIHQFDVVYAAEIRSGLPFFATTDQGEIYGSPAELFRLPMYYSINLQVAKRFHLFKRYWELRAGFDNITNHANPGVANSVIDVNHPAPTFIDGNGRALDTRIIFLGKQ